MIRGIRDRGSEPISTEIRLLASMLSPITARPQYLKNRHPLTHVRNRVLISYEAPPPPSYCPTFVFPSQTQLRIAWQKKKRLAVKEGKKENLFWQMAHRLSLNAFSRFILVARSLSPKLTSAYRKLLQTDDFLITSGRNATNERRKSLDARLNTVSRHLLEKTARRRRRFVRAARIIPLNSSLIRIFD